MQLPRLFWWLVATIVLLAVIGLIYPQQLPVSLYKLSLITMSGVIGYWLDRSLFPYARPDAFIDQGDDVDFDIDDAPEPPETLRFPGGYISDALDSDIAQATMAAVFALAMLRRAIIVGCAMLAIGLGA